MNTAAVGSVAAIIPFYRDDRWFPAALESVMSQSRVPDQVIVVDDASPAGEAVTLRDLPRSVQVIRLERNGGPGRARQMGTEAATTEFVSYLDADDTWSPDFVSACRARLVDDLQSQAVYTPIAKRLPDGTVTPFLDKPSDLDVREAIVRFHAYPALAMMFRREAVLAVGGWDTTSRAIEDWDLMIRFLDRFGTVPLVHGPIPEYRVGYSRRRRNAMGWDKLRRWGVSALRNRELLERHFGRGAYRRRFAQALRDRAERVGGVPGRTMHLLQAMIGEPLDADWPGSAA